ncbi:MAG: hypothetical protein EOO04_18380 [Chitinophagaceae bacterium]|nr:MAG: hypothetical protein EOO04_18380 [Chitinophagaceae bacterium]
MLAIQMNINVLWLGGMIALAGAAGYLLRSQQIRSFKKKVIELENEMLSNHAEILDLQRENALLEQQMKQLHIPVINMKTARDEKPGDAVDQGGPNVSGKGPIKKAGS